MVYTHSGIIVHCGHRWGRGSDSFEAQEVIGDGHGEGEQLFQGLARFYEIYRDPAPLQAYAFGQIFEFLRKDFRRGLYQQGWMIQALLPQVGQLFSKLLAPAAFVIPIGASSELPQVRNQQVPVGEYAGSDLLGNTRREDLLRASSSNPEEDFDSGAIDERTGERLEFAEDVIEIAVPGWFGGHWEKTMVVRGAQNATLFKID